MVHWPGDDVEETNARSTKIQTVVTQECPRTGAAIADWDFQAHVAQFSTKVIKGVYLGNSYNANDWEQLMHENDKISHVLVIIRNGPTPFMEEGIRYLVLDIDDLPAERIIDVFAQSNDFISEALASEGRVLVHCDTGRSRAAALVIAFLMANKGVSYKKALSKVNAQRKKMFQRPVEPNHGFVRQLRKYEKSVNSKKEPSKEPSKKGGKSRRKR